MKAHLPIETTEEGIDILDKDEHSKNEYSPMDLTENGIDISFRLWQLSKA